MPIQLNTIQELISIGQGTLQTSIPDMDTAIPGSFVNAILTGTATQVYTEQKNIQELEKDFFPQSSDGQFLEFWGDIVGLTRIAGSRASGNITIQADIFTGLPIGTTFTSGDNVYESTAVVFAGLQGGAVTLSFSGGTVTAVTATPHFLVNNIELTISGAADSDYNGTFTITVLDDSAFTYAIVGSPGAPDSGNYTTTTTYIPLPVQSVEIGADKNLNLNTILTIQTPVVTAASFGLVNGEGLTSGADIEDDESFRERILLALAADRGVFTNAQIRLAALSVLTATRVFIQNPEFVFTTDGVNISGRSITGITRSGSTATATIADTSNMFVDSVIEVSGANQAAYNGEQIVTAITPSTSFTYEVVGAPATPATGTITLDLNRLLNIPVPGYVFVFVLDDNNDPPTASSATLDAVTAAILPQLPAHTPEDALVVANPDFVSVDVQISGLDPNTSTMEDSIEANLEAFFADGVDFKEDVKLNEIIATIQNTVDSETGATIEDFTLVTPAADVTIGDGRIAIKGAVTFV